MPSAFNVKCLFQPAGDTWTGEDAGWNGVLFPGDMVTEWKKAFNPTEEEDWLTQFTPAN